ncbi:endoglucanase [Thermoflavifilum thermophilum]|uniref:Endoglucanase n=2 Tax=Thermoflavifilum thermophilum TaxID=1393122 RepID=A0A1I7NC16_9BACT|nr:endoglucanase [Thermoflavifilum thermophilum]
MLLFIALYGLVFFQAGFASALPDTLQPLICTNQVGYELQGKKIAVVVLPVSGKSSPVHAFLIPAEGEDTLWEGTSGPLATDIYTGKSCAIIDFSSFHRAGKYRLCLSTGRCSAPFVVAKDPYAQLGTAVLKAYYFLRCSEPLLPEYAEKWARAAGHPDTVVYIHPSAASAGRPVGNTIAAPGGWYDAGDYNKYIVNSGITMATLMDAYEDMPRYWDTLVTHIPETGNGIPDILNEILWNLRWMLAMQDPQDGGVYHKLTSAEFDGFEMPSADHSPRFVVHKSTAATLDFAAVMAQASRILQAFKLRLPGLADSCLHAAETAWQWALQHPDLIYDQEQLNQHFHPSITTGAYGDRHLTDEWCWAATELWLTTGDERYKSRMYALADLQPTVPTWSDVRTLAYFSLFRFQRLHAGKYANFYVRLQQQFLHLADSLLRHPFAAFATVMGGRRSDFVWGSNAVAANQGMVMLYAWRLTHNPAYRQAAASNLDYLLGRNATGYCFVTGFGTRSPMHPHHRPSIADGVREPVPGLLVGGPNPGMQDHCNGYPTHAADAAYVDDSCAYACNEIAINWNAPLVYLVNMLRAEPH